MSQSLGHSNFHIVFSTKNRLPLITKNLEAPLYAYMSGICNNLKCPAHIINGMPDHIHILLELHRTIPIATLIGKIKANSCRWIRQEFIKNEIFAWQNGYGYFAVGSQQLDVVHNYILRQKNHHKNLTYQEEMKNAYKKLRIPFDENFMWG